MTGLSFPARFTLAVLATWRLAHLVVYEDGPGDVIVRMRARAGEGWAGKLMDCFYCTSVWAAAPLAIGVAGKRRLYPVTVLAVSGAACLLERATLAATSSHTGQQEPEESQT
jgi:Protein of unknown function (DUF1360)